MVLVRILAVKESMAPRAILTRRRDQVTRKMPSRSQIIHRSYIRTSHFGKRSHRNGRSTAAPRLPTQRVTPMPRLSLVWSDNHWLTMTVVWVNQNWQLHPGRRNKCWLLTAFLNRTVIDHNSTLKH